MEVRVRSNRKAVLRRSLAATNCADTIGVR